MPDFSSHNAGCDIIDTNTQEPLKNTEEREPGEENIVTSVTSMGPPKTSTMKDFYATENRSASGVEKRRKANTSSTPTELSRTR